MTWLTGSFFSMPFPIKMDDAKLQLVPRNLFLGICQIKKKSFAYTFEDTSGNFYCKFVAITFVNHLRFPLAHKHAFRIIAFIVIIFSLLPSRKLLYRQCRQLHYIREQCEQRDNILRDNSTPHR